MRRMRQPEPDALARGPAGPLRQGRTRLSWRVIADFDSGHLVILFIKFLGLSMKAAWALRLVDRGFKQAIADSPWADLVTRISGRVASWSVSFPRAKAANLDSRQDLTEADFSRHFTRLSYLVLTRCESPCILDGSFARHCNLISLDLS